ncbi:hypothetical protein M0811_14089 [Anaeramoeba ignava]|uniref:Uncharacterized protein n=1 Tax=Anaeramoeba ignava TaxID=1746090 RepID=A0A9Q0RIU6_ANAIG|nr:hypothetical protein M0811_14089 [Anaeramoeba ignava]
MDKTKSSLELCLSFSNLLDQIEWINSQQISQNLETSTQFFNSHRNSQLSSMSYSELYYLFFLFGSF